MLLKPPFLFEFVKNLFSQAEEEILIVSPWVGGVSLYELLSSVKPTVEISLLIRLSDISDLNIDDPKIFNLAAEGRIKLFFSKKLHAKFYIFDSKKAVVGSSNLTDRGLNRFENGNIETAIYTEDKSLIGELKKLFNETEKVNIFRDNFLGFLYKLEPPFLEILGTSLRWYPFVEILSDRGKFLAKLEDIKPHKSLLNLEELSKKGTYDKNFLNAYLLAHFNESKEIYTLLGKLLTSDKNLPELGSPVFGLLVEETKRLMVSFEDFKARNPVKVGFMENTDIPVFVDLEKIIERHCAVVGVTGSGKTYMVQRLISESSKYENFSFLILDPQGEYEIGLKRFLKNSNLLKVVKFENTLLPISVDDPVELFEFFGYGRLLKNTNSGRLIKDIFAKYCKPSLDKSPFLERNLKDLFEELKKTLPEYKEQLTSLMESISEFYGEEALTNQPKLLRETLSALMEPKRITVFDFSEIRDGITRLNLAGLVLKTLIKEKRGKTLVVMEEAHNFAPERGFSSLPHGKRNLGLLMAEWIAAEGRKFGLGLLSVTQRPAQVSKFILSQANTQFLFKLIGKNDHAAVESYLSYTSPKALKFLPDLKVGECIAHGVALPFEVKVKVV